MTGLHAITCYDFICSIYGLGKINGLNLLRKNDLLPDAFVLLERKDNRSD